MSLFYYAELTYQPTHCENCSTKNENFSIVKMVRKASTITLLKIMEMPYLELQNKDFIVNHVTVILLLNLILSTLIALFLIKQNLQF